ncbi:MAG: thioesterase family protein [Paraperlucidibaca sp.]
MSELSFDYPQPHTVSVRVLARHIDVMRHTNNVVYLQWLEDVAWSHSSALGLGPDEYEAAGHGMVVRKHELSYVLPTHLDDELILATWLTEVDKLSTHRCYQFIRQRDGQTVFRGRTHFVCVDIAQGRIRRMPPAFYAAYSAAAITSLS